MWSRARWIGLIALFLVGAVGLWLSGPEEESASPLAAPHAAPHAATPQAAAAAPAAVSATAPSPSDSPRVEPAPATEMPERSDRYAREIAERMPEQAALVEEWERRLEREKLADARFQRGLEESQLRARDVDARVQAAFSTLELEPEIEEQGLLRGLRIRAMEDGDALSQAGFRPGDVLVRIDDQPLDDPAVLPLAFANARPEMTLCAVRAGQELCRALRLR
jgi:hypothetical protein